MADRVGQQLGNYRLTQLLGQGGFADVYLGEHVYLKNHAALKVLHTQLSEKDAASFVLEAQTLAHLSHPHIVRVLDFAVQDGTPFLVMEYASQGTLRQRHAKGTRLPVETVVHYVQQVAAALQYAHNQRLMHLDVKPENMLLNERTDVLLSDFGLSMFAPHTLSQSIQEMAGTVFYMAPEQIQGKPRMASDQYALGVVAYEWLCGRRPFTGSLLETATQHLTKPPPSLREHMPNLSPAIEKVVLRALAKESKQRFASVQDFATALQHAAQGTSSPHAMSLPTSATGAEVGSPFLTAPAAVVKECSSSEPPSVPASMPSPEGQVLQDTLPDSEHAKQEWQELTPSKSLIGRISEWARLMGAWWSASAGQPHLLVLSGEAGIGKTRLAEAFQWSLRNAFQYFAPEIGRQGIATAVARCYAVEDELAYTPVVSWLRAEAVRPALAALDAVWLTEVVRLLPDLLIERPGLPPPSPLQEDWQRQRLFEALARALLGTHGPLLLLLDDLQWCDRETLAWVHYLLRFDPHARLLIVGTLRAEERSTNHPLESLLVNLRREGQVSEIPLGPLDATETAALARYVAGRTLSPALAARLYQETEGNPLFVVETMRMGVSGHAELDHPPGELAAFSPPALSPTIQGVIAARLEQLSPSARELANMAAVIGRAFTFELLTAASGRDDEAVVEALDELVQRRIIREQGIEGYDFSHDKLREGAYTALSRARRRLIHRRVAEALETVYVDTRERLTVSSPDVHLADLAYHFFEAGVWAKALEYGQRAGEQAQRLYTPHITIEQVTRALDAAQHAAILPPTTLYRLRGRAYETLGDFERARLDYETTLQMAHVANNLHGEWQALMDLGFLWTQRDYAQAGTSYQQALALARQMDDPKTLAHSLNRLGNWHVNIEQPREALRYHQEALTLFQQAHESHGLAETYDLLGMASYLGGDLIQGT
ncbi:MAG TPA: protein kinase, partial [Ktedonobacteraceae bacterium]|nr:protein kinase [Ktedonobacteraceae bacterium]